MLGPGDRRRSPRGIIPLHSHPFIHAIIVPYGSVSTGRTESVQRSPRRKCYRYNDRALKNHRLRPHHLENFQRFSCLTRHDGGVNIIARCWLVVLFVCLVIRVPVTAAAPSSTLLPPEITAESAFVVDTTVGTELYALQPDERRPPASLTKVATAIVVLEHGNLDDLVTIEQSDIVDPSQSQVGLIVGDQLTVRDLLKGLLIPSGNDAAVALGRHIGATLDGTDDSPIVAFIAEMNDIVANLGLKNTQFANTTGLDQAGHYSSARDLALLTARANEFPLFVETVATPTTLLDSAVRAEGYTVNTTNDLLLEGLVQGVKTGTTDAAGGCLITSTWFGANQVITVVLGSDVEQTPENVTISPARFDDVRSILGSLSLDYQWIDPTLPGVIPGLNEELTVWETRLKPGPAIVVPVSRADELRYRLQLEPASDIDEPVGAVSFYVGSDFLAKRAVLQSERDIGEVAAAMGRAMLTA